MRPLATHDQGLASRRRKLGLADGGVISDVDHRVLELGRLPRSGSLDALLIARLRNVTILATS